MKILVATDFSEPAIRATRVAAELARRLGDSLVLVHAMEPPGAVLPEAAAEVYRVTAGVRDAFAVRLRETASELRATGLEVEAVALDGLPDHVIVETAREKQARLVVVGSHGRRAPARWILGSVAERTAATADRPVLVVRDRPDGLLASIGGDRPLKILVGIDGGPATTAAVEWTHALTRAIRSDVTLLHIYWPPHEYSRLGLHGALDLAEPNADVIAVLERDLRSQLGPFAGAPGVSLQIRPSWGPVGEALGLAATELGADLLVVGTHQRQGLAWVARGSAARIAIRAAHVPVVAVPMPARPPAGDRVIPRLHKVLVTTDLSDLGNDAVPWAYTLLRGTGGTVEVVNVLEGYVPDALHAYEVPAKEIAPEQKEAIERQLAALVPEGAGLHGITTHLSVVEGGTPAEAILATAARMGADAICLASHGRGGLARATLGSVAAKVLHGSPVPVFVLRRRRD